MDQMRNVRIDRVMAKLERLRVHQPDEYARAVALIHVLADGLYARASPNGWRAPAGDPANIGENP